VEGLGEVILFSLQFGMTMPGRPLLKGLWPYHGGWLLCTYEAWSVLSAEGVRHTQFVVGVCLCVRVSGGECVYLWVAMHVCNCQRDSHPTTDNGRGNFSGQEVQIPVAPVRTRNPERVE
jgi:hypothetical protein